MSVLAGTLQMSTQSWRSPQHFTLTACKQASGADRPGGGRKGTWHARTCAITGTTSRMPLCDLLSKAVSFCTVELRTSQWPEGFVCAGDFSPQRPVLRAAASLQIPGVATQSCYKPWFAWLLLNHNLSTLDVFSDAAVPEAVYRAVTRANSQCH